MHNVVAIIGCIFLLPVAGYFVGFITSLSDFIYHHYVFNTPLNPNQLALSFSTQIVEQLKATLVLLPGIGICAIASSHFKMHRHTWFKNWLKSFGVMLVCMLPILSISGFYLIKLGSQRTVKRKKQVGNHTPRVQNPR